MTERREGSGGTEDNVRDEFEEATKEGRRKGVAAWKVAESVEECGGTGGV